MEKYIYLFLFIFELVWYEGNPRTRTPMNIVQVEDTTNASLTFSAVFGVTFPSYVAERTPQRREHFITTLEWTGEKVLIYT